MPAVVLQQSKRLLKAVARSWKPIAQVEGCSMNLVGVGDMWVGMTLVCCICSMVLLAH
jgi:hypothetical protein